MLNIKNVFIYTDTVSQNFLSYARKLYTVHNFPNFFLSLKTFDSKIFNFRKMPLLKISINIFVTFQTNGRKGVVCRVGKKQVKLKMV